MSVVVVAPVVMLLLALSGMVLEKAYFYVPLHELERRAKRGDHVSAAFMQAVGYNGALRLFLIALTILLSTTGLVWLAHLTTWPIAAIIALVFIGGTFFWVPRTRLHAAEARLAAWCAPALAWVLQQLHPVLQPVVESSGKYFKRRTHTGLFEVADVAELFEHQVHQRDNRISPADLARVQSMLGAASHVVRDSMMPAKRVRTINAEEDVSPVLIDELHRSGQTYFPVYEGEKANLVGVLAMERVADVHQSGGIGDKIDRHLAYIHEDDSLERALRAFYETDQLLLIVINNSGKYVGVIALSDILQKLFGKLEGEAFGRYDDRDAVAHRHPDRQKVTEVVE